MDDVDDSTLDVKLRATDEDAVSFSFGELMSKVSQVVNFSRNSDAYSSFSSIEAFGCFSSL